MSPVVLVDMPRMEVSSVVEVDKRLPVTLLSGFLGSGKTTLLTYILTNKDHGLRCAVIVNDIGALNIDAALIGKNKIKQTVERIVQMENGCICCTLRGDLLEEVASLAESGIFDYLIIESTGVSEPMQVAETFAPEFADMHIQAAQDLRDEADRVKSEARARQLEKEGRGEEFDELEPDVSDSLRLAEILGAGGLPKVARLDTCVTMVDALSCLENFATADFLSDRQDPDTVDEQDERNISDLHVSQLEFADVVIINKTDLVDEVTLRKIKQLVRSLNPDADLLTSVRGKIDLKRVLDTQKFSFEKSMMSAGWLKSLREEIVPETEEYGIGSFVYRARRPFSPLRLWETVRNRLVVIQDSYEAMLEGMDISHEDDSDSGNGSMDIDEGDSKSVDFEAQPQLDPVGRLASKQACPAFGPLLRSKGFLWLASRPRISGEWSQAGVMLTIGGGSRWLCEMDEDMWPDDDETRKKMKADFEGEWSDRRQEIVFIGENLKQIQPLLTAELDACLLDDKEWRAWQVVMRSKKSHENKVEKLEAMFEDGWEDWMDPDDPETIEALEHAGHGH